MIDDIQNSERRVDALLIYPPWAVVSERAILQNSLPSLAMLSIASYLESKGFRVEVCDVHGEHLTDDDVRARIAKFQPRFVGITVLTNMCVAAHKICRIAKEEVPDCTVVVGGVHAESLPERMLRNSAIDIVARGDGEDTMFEVVSGMPIESVRGVSYRCDGKVVHNLQRSMEMNLDRFPFPAYEKVDFDLYFPAVASYRDLPAINMLVTRGCPGRCNFCNSARTVLRSRSPRSVVDQIKLLNREYGIRQIYFYDDTFTVMKQNCLELCRLLVEEKVAISWNAYIRGDCFSEDLAVAMKEAGCHQVLIGIETGSAKIAEKIGKPIDKEKYKETIQIAHRHGLEVRGSFIIGNLGETLETMTETLDFAIELDIDFFQLSIATPYPGTALFKEADENGWLLSKDWISYGQGEVLIAQPQITAEEIYKFEKYAFRRFYLRPRVIFRLLKRLTKLRQIRDYALAMYLLVLRRGRSAELKQWNCWRNNVEEDFLDLNLAEPATPRLTFELRQGNSFVTPRSKQPQAAL